MASSQYVLKRNSKGEVPNFWEWEESVHDRALLLHSDTHIELNQAAAIETEEEARTRRLVGIPQLPLENEKSTLLDDDKYAEVMALPANQRTRAEAVVVDAMQTQRRLRNAGIRDINAGRKIVFEDRAAKDIGKQRDRPKMAAWLLGDKCLSPSALEEIKADGHFKSGAGETNTADEIREIIHRVIGGVSVKDVKRRHDLEDALRALKQGTSALHLFNNRFKRHFCMCVSAGSAITQAELIAKYIYGLNLQVFEEYIRKYAADQDSVPVTVGEVMADALLYYKRVVGVDPALSKAIINRICRLHH